MGAVIGHEEAGDVNTTSGIAEGLVKQIGGMVQPGQSSLLVLADTSDPVRVAQRLGAYGGTILRTTLPADEVERLQRVIAEHDADPPGRRDVLAPNDSSREDLEKQV